MIEPQREYLIKVKILQLVFLILIILAIPVYLLIASDWNPAVYIFFILAIFGIYQILNSWHELFYENNNIVFHKSIFLKTKILIPIKDIKNCVIHYREYPKGDSSWIYIEDINNEAGCFHIGPSESEFYMLESFLKENNINYIRVYRNWNALIN